MEKQFSGEFFKEKRIYDRIFCFQKLVSPLVIFLSKGKDLLESIASKNQKLALIWELKISNSGQVDDGYFVEVLA